jgi:hypothetical protein
MGGGACIPEAISHQELASWAEITGTHPTPWEIEALRAMDKSWRRGYNSKNSGTAKLPTMRHQSLGEYCHGEKVAECRKIFSTQLEKICATCPD